MDPGARAPGFFLLHGGEFLLKNIVFSVVLWYNTYT